MPVQETIQDPLSVVQKLFSQHAENTASPLNFDPSSYFTNLFKNRQDLLQIPSLNHVPASSLQKNSLVRFRCMLQDSGLGQEMFVSMSKKKQENGADKLICHWYTDDFVDLETDQEDMVPNEQLGERHIAYCVSPPGETPWLKNASYSSSDAAEALGGTNIHGLPSAAATTLTTATLQQKYPLVGEDHVSAIVKFYDDGGSLHVGQLVDIIGVMGATSMNLDTTMEQHEVFDSHLVEFKNTPVLHAISCKNVQGTLEVPFFTNTQLDNTLYQARDIRQPLIDYIATYFGGDKLVSELVLLQLLSKVSTERHGLKIGQFCLNISNFAPDSKFSSSTQSISNMISSLVLHHISIPLTLEKLNTSRFSPQSVNENLLSGILQLVPGTHVLVDESQLSEGQLGDTGVRNMQALGNAIQHQKLTYGFPYSQFDFDVDLGFITLSTRKSLLPNHCTIAVKPVYSLDQSQENNRTLPTRQQLDIFRMYLQASKYASYEIPESISQYIQDDFVKERKQASEQHMTLPSQDDLMLRMNLCKLVALSFGEHLLTKGVYDYAVQLDQLRKSRNLEMVTSTDLVV